MQLLKANAYGHGLEFVSSTLHHLVDCFGVARLSEALRLCAEGITKPILLLEGFSEDDLPIIAVNNIQTVIHNQEQLYELKAKLPNKIKVWLKIDTGMHRLGVDLEQVEKTFISSLFNVPNVKKSGLSHFSQGR